MSTDPQADLVQRADRRVEAGISRKMRSILCLDDFQRAARRKLPRQIYGYYAGAAERGTTFSDNFQAFRDLHLVSRVLADVSERNASRSLLGVRYRQPFGIAPMGLSALATFEGDLALARSAGVEGIPMIMSAASLLPMERVAVDAGGRWFQAYLPGEAQRIEAMLDRVASAGFDHFVLTVDVPVAANRENNIRNGFSVPIRPSARLIWDGLSHPAWTFGTLLRTLRHGMPRFENMDAFRGPPIFSRNLVRAIGARDQLSWKHVALIRKRWAVKFVLKGILSADTTRLAREHGIDGVVVSNHGGRQLDGAVASLSALSDVVREAGSMAVMLDGGIRRGSDVLKALAMGARFVFVGRPFLFAAAAAGAEGVRHAIQLLSQQIDRDMAMLGVRTIDEIGAWSIGADRQHRDSLAYAQLSSLA